MKQYPGQALFLDESGEFSTEYGANTLGVFTPFPTPFASEQKLSKVEPPKISKVQVGWYRFTDKTFSANPIEGKEIDGVVAYFERGIPQSISIKEEKLAYCEDDFWIGANSEADGKDNTDKILEVCYKQGVRAPAAEWAVAQEGFIPANKQWLKIIANLEIINASLERIGAPIIDPDRWYWSSTEHSSSIAWALRSSNGYLSYNYGYGRNKNNPWRVRCVLN